MIMADFLSCSAGWWGSVGLQLVGSPPKVGLWQWGVIKVAAAGGDGGVAQPAIRELERIRLSVSHISTVVSWF